MCEVIRIKPHHFVDIVTQFGEGAPFEPHPYGHAVHTVAERTLADLDVMLEMDLGADDICSPCIHNIDGLCDDTLDTSYRPGVPASKREWNLILDRRWCDRLHVAAGDRMTVRAFVELLRDRAGDISDIYRENPPGRTADRAAKLAAGIGKLLGR